MTDTSGDGIPDDLAEELGLDPHHEHHPLFADAVMLIDEYDTEFLPEFVELVTVSEPDPVAVPLSIHPLLDAYVDVGMRDSEIVPQLNEQLLSAESIEFIERQLHVLTSAEESFVAELAMEERLGDPDWDDDGLENWVELRYGTSYMDPDTSGDGLYDSEAVALGLDPTGQHEQLGEIATELRGEGDPVSGNELKYLQLIADNPNGIADQLFEYGFHEDGEITDSDLERASDPDRDGLITAIEREINTDPESADSSGDGLMDGWKYNKKAPGNKPLPDAEPSQMDLYVQVLYTPNATPLTDREKATIKDWWSDFNVENSDGSTGINLHIEEGPGGGELDEEPETKTGEGYHEAFYNEEYMGDRYGTHHLTIFGRIEHDQDIDGIALIGGQTSVVVPGLESRIRLQVLSHELLHNVVGELDERYVSDRQIRCGEDPEPDPYHTCEGLLALEAESTSIVSGVEEQLTAEGFASDISEEVGGVGNKNTEASKTAEVSRSAAPQVVSCNCFEHKDDSSGNCGK